MGLFFFFQGNRTEANYFLADEAWWEGQEKLLHSLTAAVAAGHSLILLGVLGSVLSSACKVVMPGSVCKGSWLQEAAPALQVTSSAYSAQHLLVPYRQIKALWRRISTQMYRHKVEVYIQLNILFYGKMNKWHKQVWFKDNITEIYCNQKKWFPQFKF